MQRVHVSTASSAKPAESKIQLSREGQHCYLLLPYGVDRSLGRFLLLFAVIWDVLTLPLIGGLFVGTDEIEAGLLLLLFPLTGVALTAVALGLFFMQVGLSVDPQRIRLVRKIVGYPVVREKRTADVRAVELVTCYEKNNQPVLGLGLLFEDRSWLKFGSGLSDPEKNWLLAELRELFQVAGR